MSFAKICVCRAIAIVVAQREGGLRNARKQERVSLLRRLSLGGNREAPISRYHDTTDVYVNPRTFASTGISQAISHDVHRAARRTRFSTGARFRCLERHALRRMYTPTRDGHAPKRLLITSILLPLTAHYRASRNVSFNHRVSPLSEIHVERDRDPLLRR